MSMRPITKELYDAMVVAYREAPGNASHAARQAGCDRRMAKRGWEEGWTRSKAWARPISVVLADERMMARARAAELEAQREKQKEELREKGAKEAIEAQAQENQILKVARSDVLGALIVAAELTPAMRTLAGYVKKYIEAGGESISPREAMSIINRHAGLVSKAMAAAETIVQLGRTDRGQPGFIVGVQEEMSPEEAADTIGKASAALARAQARGFVPIPEPLPLSELLDEEAPEEEAGAGVH